MLDEESTWTITIIFYGFYIENYLGTLKSQNLIFTCKDLNIFKKIEILF